MGGITVDTSDRPVVLLAPTDLSEASLGGVIYAAGLARRLGGVLFLLQVVRPREIEEGIAQGKFADTQLDEVRTGLLWWFTTFVPEPVREGLPVHAMAAVGHPEEEIPTVAESLKAEMIVMATHGRTGLRRAVLGSVAEAVLRHAPCAVVTLRATGPAKGLWAAVDHRASDRSRGEDTDLVEVLPCARGSR